MDYGGVAEGVDGGIAVIVDGILLHSEHQTYAVFAELWLIVGFKCTQKFRLPFSSGQRYTSG